MLYCTYHPQGEHYHKYFMNFGRVAANDAANGIGIRVCEQRTEERIALLRKRYGIPDDQFPPDEWLWLDEMLVSPSVMVVYAGGLRGRTTLTRPLSERSPNVNRPSLIELGYVESRYIARPSYYFRSGDLATPLYTDWQGQRFALVDDWQGYYVDADGELHDATEEGCVVSKQYLYRFDRVNAAIAKLHGGVPPVLPRWQQKEGAPAQETPSIAGAKGSGCASLRNAQPNRDLLGGNLNSSSPVVVSTGENTTETSTTSIIGSDEGDLRTAPWTPETFTRLVARTLQELAPYAAPLPDPVSLSPEAWRTDVQEPLERLTASVAMLDPARAWEQIDLMIRYMCTPGSPSWWQRDKKQGGRKTKAPITIKQIANQRVIEWKDYNNNHDWYPGATTRYDGPPLEEDVAAPAGTRELDTDALPVMTRGMLRNVAQALCDEITAKYPDLRLFFLPLDEEDDARMLVSFEYGENEWHDLESPEKWRRQSPKLRRRIAEALALGAARAQAGADMVPEPPIIVAPPEQVAAADDDELAEEHLYEESQTTQEKQGMSEVIADLLQEQIRQECPDLTVVPHIIGGDHRVVLTVEARGIWAEIDSPTAWRACRASRGPLLIQGGADGQDGAMDGAP